MVDPDPARGMPLQLQRYWLAGKGAAKILWNIPGDFLRCVRQLRKYFPTDPEGLCNILHTKATGGPPGHGSLEKHTHSITVSGGSLTMADGRVQPIAAGTKVSIKPVDDALVAATALLAAQPVLGEHMWAGPLAPINRPTGEPGRTRIFEPGSIDHRMLPLPMAHRRMDAVGHQSAVTVARILGMTVGPDHNGQDWLWGWGDWLDPDIVPEVKEAKYLVDQGVVGASVDPGGPVAATIDPETRTEHMMKFTVGGATLVRIPAFDQTRIYNMVEGEWPDDDPDMDHSALDMDAEAPDCGCGSDYASEGTFSVNQEGWRGLPLAPREAVFDNDDAVKRITQHASNGQDVAKLRQAFLWRDDRLPETDPTSYRLPIGDIINGRLTLVYHAIYAAAALLSGAHGGLPNVPDADKARLRSVISDIYPEMATAFNDSSIRAPWDQPADVAARQQGMSMAEEFAVADNANEPYGDVQYADPGYQKDGKKRYPIDTEEHARAAWGYINQQSNASRYSPVQLKAVKARIVKALKKFGADVSEQPQEGMTASGTAYVVTESGYPLEPPAEWFDDPKLTAKTALSVTPEGRVYGHLAAWNECHRDVTNQACVMAPKSRKGYAPFHLGSVFTAEGDEIRVGKIVMDTRHASINLGYTAAAIHYDNTGDEVAVVRAGEDEFGIYVAGAIVPEADARKVAKLRRSPLSGDWRAVEGNLELTAALAVNVPAFPVYSLDGEDRLALVAAGTVVHDGIDVEHQVIAEAPTGNEDSQEERMWLFRQILEDEDAILQWERGHKLAQFFTADGEAPPEVSAIDPVYGEEAMIQRQSDAQFSIIEEPAGEQEADNGSAESTGTGVPVEQAQGTGARV